MNTSNEVARQNRKVIEWHMTIVRQLSMSASIILSALLPRLQAGRNHSQCADAKQLAPDTVTVHRHDVPAYLADFSRALDRKQQIALFFPDALLMTAPFLLFRIKRQGFSRCRVFRSTGGITLHASR